MILVSRAMVVATLALLMPLSAGGQELGTLRIRAILTGSDAQPTPVARHELLISDNPSSAPPRLVTTGLDGTAEVRLRPGNYTVESDHPIAFNGTSYLWTVTVDVVAGRDVVLELTATNADTEAAAATTASSASSNDPSFLLPQWQDSIVALWTPTARASGFLIDSRGLIATNQLVVGAATSVEVQLTPTVKVGGNVLAADSTRDAAIVWIDPAMVASVKPVPLGCTETAPPIVEGQRIFTMGSPFRQPKELRSGTVSRADARGVASDVVLTEGSLGGPVFNADGGVVGITSLADAKERRRVVRTVRTADVCGVLATAEEKMRDAARPSATRLPVEPARPSSVAQLKEAAERRFGSLNPYQISTAGFDVHFITPVIAYGPQLLAERASQRSSRSKTPPAPEPVLIRPLTNFLNWSTYVEDFPPVLLVRVTPKLAESLWTTVARGAARTQGMDIPAIKRVKSGFLRMRTYCGDDEVTPIHPFKLEHQVSESSEIDEGLYVFDPGAFGPHCQNVKLVLYSQKEPDREDVRLVESRVVDQIWQDFAAYRDAALASSSDAGR
jgi:trypsin-like peptidase